MVSRLIFLSVFIVALAAADTVYVCSSGTMEDGRQCDYKNLQAAVDAVPDGTTIIMRSGDTSPHVVIPGGRHDLTFKSSQIDNYPRGYRITRGHPALAKIRAIGLRQAVQIGDDFTFGVPDLGTDIVRFAANHGFTPGTAVTVQGRRFSPFYCESAGIEPFGVQCPQEKVGSLMIRGNSFLRNGDVVYFRSPVLPSPLQEDTPYYIVGFVRGAGTNESPDQFQIATQQGGVPLALTGYKADSGLVMEVGMAPFRVGDVAYVVQTPTRTTLKLSQTPGGEPVPFTQTSSGYNGAGFVAGSQVVRLAAVRNVVFDGFEMTNDPDHDPWHLMYVSATSPHRDGEHTGIRVLRCWLHADDDQDSMPHQGIYLGARDSEVGWSIIEGMWSNFADTQAIALVSRGNVWVHDNLLSATGECLMSGGNFPPFFPDTASNFRIERNYFYKPLTWWSSLQFSPVNDVTFQLVSRNSSKPCSTVAADKSLSGRCFWYEGSDLPTPSWRRYELGQDLKIGLDGVTSSGRMILYAQGGVIRLQHNLNGTVSCPSEVECIYVEKPFFPEGSTRLSGTVVNRGKIDPGTWWLDNRPPWVKNALESKYGDEWHVEGNVFHRQFMFPGGVISQDTLIQFTLAANGSSDVDAAAYTVSSSNSVFRNNIFRHSGQGITGNGKTFGPSGTFARKEMSGLGKVVNNRVENNLFVDIGSSEWTNTVRGAPFMHQLNEDWKFVHNTAVDIRQSQVGIKLNKNIDVSSNVFIPYDAATHPGALNLLRNFPEVNGDGVTGWVPAANPANPYHFLEGDSRFERNILLNRNAWTNASGRPTWYPSSTYLNDVAKDRVPDLSDLFVTWVPRPQDDWAGVHYREGNYRLRAPEAQKYPAVDQRVIGADIDEIESLTGPFGKDVEEGIPTFAERSERKAERSGSEIVISYLPVDSDACSIRVWDNESYAGPPRAEATDESAELSDGRRQLRIQGPAADIPLYVKRVCGAAVDVFMIPVSQ
jgi:hypothetical protein